MGIPINWTSTPIGNLCSLINGRAFKPSDWKKVGLPIVRIQNLNSPDAAYNYYTGAVEEKFLINNGQLLFAWSGTPGTSFGAHIWKGGKAVLNQHIFKVDFDERKLDKKFFRLAINQKLNELIEKAHGGVGLRHVTKGKFEKTEILLPPYEQQQKIVAKVEELFSELDNAAGCLSFSDEMLNGFYQSVLDHAFSNCNEYRNLNELLSQKLSNGYSGKPVSHKTEFKVLSLSSTTSGIFLDQHFKYLDENGLRDRDIWCAPNDILIQRGNTIEYVGVPALYTGQPNMFIFPDLMIRARANDKFIDPKYLYYALSSPKIRNHLRKKAKGSAGTMPKINQTILDSTPIPICESDMQKQLVQKIERELSISSALQKQTQMLFAKTKILRQSILKKAFSGQLVTQDPHDEPASVLLERIRVEKEGLKPNGKKPKEKWRAA